MSCTGTKRSRSRGTASSSHSQKSKSKRDVVKKYSAPKTEKISKYFSKSEEMGESSGDLSDSPYKNCLNEVRNVKLINNSASDLDDFKTPKAINKVSKIVHQKQAPKNTKKRKKATGGHVPLRKFVEDNFKHVDVNPEHLQMALALSESSYQAENPDDKILETQEKMDSFKKALEKYGFGYSKTRVSVKQKKDCDSSRKNRKSRYRYVTPVLKIRTEEERQALISSKVTLILSRNNRKSPESINREAPKLFCESLQKHVSKNTLFNLHRLELAELNDSGRFYCQSLEVEPFPTSCGSLLKDWGRIPGREVTPERINSKLTNGEACIPPRGVTFSGGGNETTPTSWETPSPHQSVGKENLAPEASPSNYYGDISSVTSPVNLCQSPDLIFERKSSQCDLIMGEASPKCLKVCSPVTSPINLCESPDLILESKSSEYGDSIMGEASPKCSKVPIENNCQSIDLTDSDQEFGGGDFTSEQTFLYSVEPLSPKVTSPSSSKQNYSQKLDLVKEKEREACESSNKVTHGDLIATSGFLPNPKLSNCDEKSQISYDKNNSTPRQGSKRPYDCISPDLFGSDDDYPSPPLVNSAQTPPITRLRGGLDFEEMECYDLTQSDHEEEEENFEEHVRLVDPEGSIGRRSDLNVTDYVRRLLCENKATVSPQKLEKISTSEEDLQQESQESIYISDEELNYSSVFGNVSYKKKVKYDLSDEDECCGPDLEVSLADRIKVKFSPQKSPKKLADLSPNVDNLLSPPPCGNSPSLRNNTSLQSIPGKNNTFHQSIADNNTSHQSIADNNPPHQSIAGNNTSHQSIAVNSTSHQSFAGNNNSHHSTADNNTSQESTSGTNKLPPLDDSCLEIPHHSPLSTKQSASIQITPINTPKSNDSFDIKTSNVTPMANYDEMDTPKIVKELDKFGLKPLRRQKGAKLLRYIYESTHPVLQDCDGKVVKKRRTQFPQNRGIVGDVGDEENLIFERTQSKKIASCRVPLHVVWHNFVMSNPKVRENILLYEPLQLEVLHSMLREQGFKFHINDLLAFLDKKCVTIRTAQGQRYKKPPNLTKSR